MPRGVKAKSLGRYDHGISPRHLTKRQELMAKKARRDWGFDARIAEKFIALASAGMTDIAICEREDMPSVFSIIRWRKIHPDFDRAYREADEARCTVWASEMVDLPMTIANAKFNNPIDAACYARGVQLRLNNIRWLLAKRMPAVYGDFHQIRHADHEGGPLVVPPPPITLENLTGEQLEELGALIDSAEATALLEDSRADAAQDAGAGEGGALAPEFRPLDVEYAGAEEPPIR